MDASEAAASLVLFVLEVVGRHAVYELSTFSH